MAASEPSQGNDTKVVPDFMDIRNHLPIRSKPIQGFQDTGEAFQVWSLPESVKEERRENARAAQERDEALGSALDAAKMPKAEFDDIARVISSDIYGATRKMFWDFHPHHQVEICRSYRGDFGGDRSNPLQQAFDKAITISDTYKDVAAIGSAPESDTEALEEDEEGLEIGSYGESEFYFDDDFNVRYDPDYEGHDGEEVEDDGREDRAGLYEFVGQVKTFEIEPDYYVVAYDKDASMIRLYFHSAVEITEDDSQNLEHVSIKGTAFDAARIMAFKETDALGVIEVTGRVGVDGSVRTISGEYGPYQEYSRFNVLEEASFKLQPLHRSGEHIHVVKHRFDLHVSKMERISGGAANQARVTQKGNHVSFAVEGTDLSNGEHVTLIIGVDESGVKMDAMLANISNGKEIKISVDGYKIGNTIAAPEVGVQSIEHYAHKGEPQVERVDIREYEEFRIREFTDSAGRKNTIAKSRSGSFHIRNEALARKMQVAISPDTGRAIGKFHFDGSWQTRIVNGRPESSFAVQGIEVPFARMESLSSEQNVEVTSGAARTKRGEHAR